MSHEPTVEELLRALAREDVRPRLAFKVQLTERLIAAMSARPRALWWRPVLVGITALLVLALVGWFLTPRMTTGATLVVETGEARVSWQRPVYFRWTRSGTSSIPAGQKFLLAEGDRVVLSGDGSGNLTFPDESRLYLAGGTAFVLEEMDPDRQVTRVTFTAGEVRAEVPPLPGRLFEVGTGAATVRVYGTVFRTRVVASDHTYSATDDGTTRVTLLDPAQGYPSVDVPAGYEVDAVIGQPLQVRPQAPHIDHLTLNGVSVEAEGILISNQPGLGIFGKTDTGSGDALLILEGRLVDRAPITPEGEFRLHFQAPAEGEYALCIAIEAPDGARSPCVSLSYRYDTTPPGILRLLEPAMPEVSGETVTIRGETEVGVRVRLNGEPIPVDPAGMFTTRWTLQPGENQMTLESCDEAGNCTRLEFVLIRR
ncbi:MAG: FecR domain-containing protein [Thermoflexales bacterium]|nr:FecR domain-containing protein [Thermoflexales bacterium]